MSLSIVKYPDRTVNSNNLTVSKWNAVHHPIKFQMQRRDFQITFFQSSPILMQVKLSGFAGDINTILAIGEDVYIESPNGFGNFVVNSIIGLDSFDVEFGIFSGIGDPAGHCNFLNRKNYFVLVNIWEVNPMNQYILLGTSENKPSAKGIVDVDTSSFLKSLVGYTDDFLFNVLNQIDLQLGNRYNISFSENWIGFEGEFSVMSTTDLRYFTNSAKQIKDLYGENMGEYVPFLNTIITDPQAKFLTDFKEPTYFPGLPFSLSFIYSEELVGIKTFKHEDKFDINGANIGSTDSELDNSQLPFVNRLMIDQGYVNEDYIEVYLQTEEVLSPITFVAPDYVAPGYVGGGTDLIPVDDSLVGQQQ